MVGWGLLKGGTALTGESLCFNFSLESRKPLNDLRGSMCTVKFVIWQWTEEGAHTYQNPHSSNTEDMQDAGLYTQRPQYTEICSM